MTEIKKAKTAPTKPSHPTFTILVKEAIIKLGEGRYGSSRQAIAKYIIANYNIDEIIVNKNLKLALKKGLFLFKETFIFD